MDEKSSRFQLCGKLIRMTYKTKSGQMLTIFFQTGLVIYSVEKAKLYLLGKRIYGRTSSDRKYN